jgi:hypothetical protein
MFVLDIGFDRSKHNARSKRFALNVKSSISSQKNFKLCGIKEGREFTLKTLIQLVENCATKFKRKNFFSKKYPLGLFLEIMILTDCFLEPPPLFVESENTIELKKKTF